MTTTSGRAEMPAVRRLTRGGGPDGVRTVDSGRVFAAAMAGEPCTVLGMDGGEQLLPMARWAGEADSSDDALLALCQGTTLDVGCGPGRLTSRLAALGHVALGVDIVAAAVERTRERGASAVQRDLFERLPGEGRWQTVLLADGNIGIGGDPRALLARMVELAAPGGRLVVETAPPGVGLQVHEARLRTADLVSTPFPWAILAVDRVEVICEGLPLSLHEVHQLSRGTESRWIAVLTSEES